MSSRNVDHLKSKLRHVTDQQMRLAEEAGRLMAAIEVQTWKDVQSGAVGGDMQSATSFTDEPNPIEQEGGGTEDRDSETGSEDEGR